jgi:ABC-type multidrug transport system ATPase subunit
MQRGVSASSLPPESRPDSAAQDTALERVMFVLGIMGLHESRTKVIPERPSQLGEEGAEIQCLSIAMELLSMPRILLLEDAALGLDNKTAASILQRLRQVANEGVTVLCSLPKCHPSVRRQYVCAHMLMQRNGARVTR